MPRRFFPSLIAALITLAVPWTALPQTRITGQIVGTVKDPSGAVVAKAELALVDNGTGAKAETRSGADGGFVFPNLQPGRYRLTATCPGFEPVILREVVVQTSRSTDLVVQLRV